MTGSVIQLSMNFGYPGSYARMPDDIVVNKPVKTGTADIPFGYAVMLNTDNTFQKGDANLTAANFAGIAVREVRQALVLNADQGVYAAKTPCDVLARGNTVIKLARGTPAAGAAVLFRIAADAEVSGSAVGDFEAGSATANKTIALTNMVFTTGEVDANGVVEVSIKSRNNN